MKKGQITIFIIIGIIIFCLIFFFFIIKNSSLKSKNGDVDGINGFVENCIRTTGAEVVYEVGKHGGYYFPPNISTDSGIAYHYFNDKSYVPSKQGIEKEISFYTARKLFFCTRNFVDFPDYNVTQGEIDIKTTIEDDGVVFSVNYPLSIKKGENVWLIKTFNNILVPVRLGVLYNSAVDFEKKSFEGACLSCLLKLSLENDFYIDMIDYDKSSIVFIFRDEKSRMNNEDFRYIFANKYKSERVEI